jgi:DegV family protein with EDD domain
MKSKIVVDSCVDINEQVFTSNDQMERVPFRMIIDGEEMVDINLNTSTLLSRMKASTNKVQTMCPSPNDFLTAYRSCENVFVVTISSKLSGSYNSAIVAKNILQDDELSQGFVHVFDSKSASAGESLVALKVKQLIKENLPNSEIIEKTNEYISGLTTLFILESFDNLIKNGRISHMSGFIGSMLHIVPIMGSDGDGVIELKTKVRGRKKAMNTLLEMIGKDNTDFTNTILSITYVNDIEKAQMIKEEIQRKYAFKQILIFKSGGLSTVYADDGGIVIAY